MRQLSRYLEEAPTASQVLDFDRASGMRSDTIKGDLLAWKKLPLYLVKMCVANRYLFDYVKFETMRQEIDAVILKQHRWVLYENKDMPADILRNLG